MIKNTKIAFNVKSLTTKQDVNTQLSYPVRVKLSLMGRQVKLIEIPTNTSTFVLDTSDMAPGTYELKTCIVVNGQEVYSEEVKTLQLKNW